MIAISQDNNTNPHGVCRVANAIQRKELPRSLYLIHHVIDLKKKNNKKQIYKFKKICQKQIYKFKKICHHLV